MCLNIYTHMYIQFSCLQTFPDFYTNQNSAVPWLEVKAMLIWWGCHHVLHTGLLR